MSTDAVPTNPVPLPVRLRTPILILLTFWIFTAAMRFVEVSMLVRFGARCLAWLVLMLSFLGWWLFQRRLQLRDRWLALGWLAVVTIVTSFLTHKSITVMPLLMDGFPLTFTAWTVWLAISRGQTEHVQRTGFAVVTVLCLGSFTLARYHGIDGMQRPQLSWRWTPSPEEQFLAARPTTAQATPRAAREWSVQPGDWTDFRGPNRTGIVAGFALPDTTDWTTRPPKRIWQRRVGPGWSSVIVIDRYLVTQEQRDEFEAIVCYDAATGDEVWVHEDRVRFTEAVSGAGPRGTPAYADGRVFALGASGHLKCVAAENGELLWSHDFVAETKSTAPQWGYSASPLVIDGLVLVHAGGEKGQSLLAFRADSGELAWSQPGGQQTYSSPQLVTLRGQRQVLVHDNKVLASVQPEDGRRLWEFPNNNDYSVPMLQPRAVSDRELLVSFEPDLALLEVQRESDQWSVRQRWKSNRLKAGFNDVAVQRDRIIGLDDGILCCLDLRTGQRLWKKTRYGHGQLLHLPDANQLLVLSETGTVSLWPLSDDRPSERTKFPAVQGKTWNHPALAHGRLYVRNGEEMACFQLAE